QKRADKTEHKIYFTLSLACALLFGVLVILFQNRTVWLSLAPMLALLALAQAYTPRRKTFVCFAGLAGLAIALFLCAKTARVFERLNNDFALNRELNFSIEQTEKNPASVPMAKPDQPAMTPTTALTPTV